MPFMVLERFSIEYRKLSAIALVLLYYIIALFNNMPRTLKFKAKLTNTFYAAVNHYRIGHPNAETSKMDRNPPITNQKRDLSTSLKYRACD